MQLKPLFNELTQRLKRHKSYQIAMARMEKKYPLLTKHDLEQKYTQNNHMSSLEEVCSICWENLKKHDVCHVVISFIRIVFEVGWNKTPHVRILFYS